MSDPAARQTALDPGRSFIVQAPAGSGKTELLIQRYLALLAKVELPEQIVAITFTRKAAAEMRGRILQALRAAAAGGTVAESHRHKTRELATAVLSHAEHRDWDLLMQPQRLRIDTLDALNAWLAQRLPLLSGGVAGADVAEDAREFYLHATRRVIQELGQPGALGEALHPLLHRLDNRYDRLETLLAELLPSRDQWLPYVVRGSDAELREALELALQRLVGEQLARVATDLPEEASGALVALLHHAARSATNSSLAAIFAPWQGLDEVPEPAAESLDAWRALPELLLVKSGTWRKRLSADIGFGSDHAAEQEALRELIVVLQEQPGLQEELASIRKLPSPHYDNDQWQVLAALRTVLRFLAAELRVVFSERNTIDFIELAQSAQNALGESDAPSELLLALDRRIQHILVDEFQDTSHAQLRLLKLLTAGWQRGDGRTLFLVGDPMQSIYRFRNADMSLFLRTKAQGIGDVHCEPLTLERNFRSSPVIIDWVNTTFPRIFPSEDELGASAARFHPCIVAREVSDDATVEVHALRNNDPQTEIDRVVEILLGERRRYSDRSVAILVQSRSHLVGLHEQLRARRLDVHAVEIEAPNQRQLIQDLLGLTRALTHSADRIAWLGILKAPWCGLTWADLHELVSNDRERTVWALMSGTEGLERLSDDGRRRLLHCREILQRAFDCRAEQPLARWVERTWVTLGGPVCLGSEEELEQADQFFSKLDELDRHGDLDDPAALETHYSDPRGQREPPRESGIEIMTIHRAKGLEFDTVLLLGLGRPPPPDQGRGLYWVERVATTGDDDFLLAPLTATADTEDALADLLRQINRDRDRAERARLLYVATTRARNRLHLIGRLKPGEKRPDPRSLLMQLWPQVEHRFDAVDAGTDEPTEIPDAIEPVLRRLADGFEQSFESNAEASDAAGTVAPMRPEFAWAGPAALQIGIVVHDALQDIADTGPDNWSIDLIHDRTTLLRGELHLLGVDEEDLDRATERVIEALCSVLDDATGRWILQEHSEAASELPLTIHSAAGLEHVCLDRTFVDDGTRWIIDFKTSAHEGGERSAFLDSEVERYRAQLDRYADAMAALDDRPIRVGLYFPLLQAFRDWVPVPLRHGRGDHH